MMTERNCNLTTARETSMKIEAYDFPQKRFKLLCDCRALFLVAGLPSKIQCPSCKLYTSGKWLLKTFTKKRV